MQQLVQILELMSGVDFIGLLLNSVLANTHLPRASHYAAGGCMCELLRKMDRVATFANSVHTGECSTLATSVESCVESLQPSLCALLQHTIRNIGMPAQHVEPGTFLGRHMLYMGMRILQLVCRVLPSDKWSECAPHHPPPQNSELDFVNQSNFQQCSNKVLCAGLGLVQLECFGSRSSSSRWICTCAVRLHSCCVLWHILRP